MTRFLILSAFALSLAACSTIEGAGQDIENAGEGIQGAAVEAEDDIAN
ncbi:entericidin A/B family lipoprotein [Aliiroseovarius sp. PTFE2010]